MYISIDRTNLRFLHKHHDNHMLSQLLWIEAPQVVTTVCPVYGRGFLHGYTDLEKRGLYCSATGEAACVWSGTYLQAILMELVKRLPECTANPIEVQVQASKLANGDEDPYIYVPGKMVAQLAPDLYEAPHLRAPRHENEPLMAAMGLNATSRLYEGAEAADAAAFAAGATVAATAPSVPTAPRSRPQPGTSTPRAGGVRDKVWAVADEMWTEAGKPTDPKLVLALRKQIMDRLETQHDVKRTSSSNELGNWQKNRI